VFIEEGCLLERGVYWRGVFIGEGSLIQREGTLNFESLNIPTSKIRRY
jgi:hypothetical protein